MGGREAREWLEQELIGAVESLSKAKTGEEYGLLLDQAAKLGTALTPFQIRQLV